MGATREVRRLIGHLWDVAPADFHGYSWLAMSILDRPAGGQPPSYFARSVRTARRYDLNLAPPATTTLSVVCGGYEECAPDYRIRRDDFPHYVLEWVVRGRGRVRLGGEWRSLQGGALIGYGPGVPHEIETDPETPLAKHFVSFTGKDASRLLTATRAYPPAVAAAPPGPDIAWLFESMLRDGSRGDATAESLCKHLLRYLLARLAAATPAPQPIGARATFDRCDGYLTQNAASLRSLEELAAGCGVSPAYLCRLYHRFAGQSPYQRLLRLRMNLVAERLLSDGGTLRAIGADMGYDDPYLLSRQFKTVFGVAPNVFRRIR